MSEYTMTIPANTDADIYLPVVQDQAEQIQLPDGVTYLGMEERNGQECAKFHADAGEYTLTIPQ